MGTWEAKTTSCVHASTADMEHVNHYSFWICAILLCTFINFLNGNPKQGFALAAKLLHNTLKHCRSTKNVSFRSLSDAYMGLTEAEMFPPLPVQLT
jgi:hypothetical protein